VLRAFVAVEIPPGLLESLAAVQGELRRRGVQARWTRPENLHLTLRFLGDVPAERVANLATALRSAVAGHSGFRLTSAGIGVFPGLRRPRVLWAGLRGATADLARLQQEIEERLEAIGFPREARDFHGHLTLGRFDERVSAGLVADAIAAYASASFGSFDVREVVLFQSDLQPRGPVYAALARAPLGETP
jgi:2'-5' RNA ligase